MLSTQGSQYHNKGLQEATRLIILFQKMPMEGNLKPPKGSSNAAFCGPN